MKTIIKKILKPITPHFILFSYRNYQIKKLLKNWENNGCPVPPPHVVKQMAIIEYQQKYNYETLIETGTFLGEMVEAQKKRFKRIISIELGMDLYWKAKEKFKKDKNITILQGDSGKVLPKILLDINEPVIFWLDGHYSAGITAKGEKESPIFEELNAILIHSMHNHVLLIDDARCFNGEGDYPTIEELKKFVKSKNRNYKSEVKHDIIRFTA